MAAEEFPPALRQFISRYIRSVEQLEILLLLRQKPDKEWSVQAVYDTILSTPQSIERWLQDLTRSGLLTAAGTSYRYNAESESAGTMALLADFYKTTPVRLIETIYRPKADAAQSFADAFKLNPPNQK